MALVNLTPHPVIVRDGAGAEIARIGPSGRVARAAETCAPGGQARIGDIAVPVEVKTYGAVEGLPAVPDGATLYVVPLLTALAARTAGRDTSDLLFPARQTRDADGTVNGCAALGRLG